MPPHVRKQQRVVKTKMLAQIIPKKEICTETPTVISNLSSNLLPNLTIINTLLAQNLVLRLVGEFEVFFKGYGVLDGHEHDGQSNEQTTSQKRPR